MSQLQDAPHHSSSSSSPSTTSARARRQPRLRTLLILLVALVALYGGLRLWTSGPDTVRITITHSNGGNGTQVRLPPVIRTVTVDRTLHDAALAQRLQQDLAMLPLVGPLDAYSCPMSRYTYDTYTLTWYRLGLPVEQATADRMNGCAFWTDDWVFIHRPYTAEVLYADIDRAVGRIGP